MVLTLLSNIKTQRKISSNLFGLIKKYEQCIHYMYSNIAIFHFCQDKKNTLRRRSWPLLFLDRVWPPRSSALCFLVQKEVEREKKKPKNFFFRDDKVFDPIGFPQITSLFSQFFFCSQIFFDSQIFFHFINHCFPRQIVVGWIKNKPKNFFRGAKFLKFFFIHRFFSSFTSQIFFVSLHIYRGV